MPFDWFQRKPNSPAQAPAEPETSAETAPASEPAEAPPSAEDYLAFAKAAYANLKAKQAAAESETTAPVEPETAIAADPELTDTPADPEDPEISEELSEIASEPVESLSEPPATPVEPEAILITMGSTSTEASTSSASDDAVPTASVSAEPEVTPEPEITVAATPKAFFELTPRTPNRLTVVDDQPLPTPAPPAPAPDSPAPLSPDQGSDLNFDDGFRWSADILAAQGRRPEDITLEEISWLQKLRQGLGKTRRSLVNQLRSLVGQGPLTAEAVEDIETLLLQADVGIAATDTIIAGLQARLRQEALPPDAAVTYLKEQLRLLLDSGNTATFAPVKDSLNIWLMVGVNGVGKTTTLGKIASLAQQSGYRCLIAAADTFRAAAVKQLEIWGERAGVDVIANESANADPAAVVYDAIAAAQARNVDLLLVDTAGRLQNKKNLMAELTKIRRIVTKKADNAHIEALLVLDATLGQNGLRQAQVFAEAAELTGVILTKLDGTAKGGVALAVVKELGLPIRFIGVGESISDLRPFSSYEFVEALLSE